jgi:hypothetical protein
MQHAPQQQEQEETTQHQPKKKKGVSLLVELVGDESIVVDTTVPMWNWPTWSGNRNRNTTCSRNSTNYSRKNLSSRDSTVGIGNGRGLAPQETGHDVESWSKAKAKVATATVAAAAAAAVDEATTLGIATLATTTTTKKKNSTAIMDLSHSQKKVTKTTNDDFEVWLAPPRTMERTNEHPRSIHAKDM